MPSALRALHYTTQATASCVRLQVRLADCVNMRAPCMCIHVHPLM